MDLPFSAEYLQANGIDPASVSSYGGQSINGQATQTTLYMRDGSTREIGAEYTPGQLADIFAGREPVFQPGATTSVPGSGGGSSTPGLTSGSGGVNGKAAASAAMVLKSFGLDGLVPLVDGWIRNGMSWEEAQVALYDTSTDAGKIFDARFPAMQQRRAKGLNPISPAEYINYETQAKQVLRASGLPQGFYDSPDDFTNLLVGDVSLNELNDRVTQGYAEVANAPKEVRDAFGEFFGANGDAALAAYILDDKKALPVLKQEVNIAKIGGASKAFGFNLGVDKARQIADTGASYESARAGFDSIQSMDSLFAESVSEKEDLTAEAQGIDAAFGLDKGEARKALNQRVEKRVATTKGVGGAAASQQGAFGLGSAKQ